MSEFVGRERETARLRKELRLVSETREHPGRCILLRGRRRVGKSRLVEVFCQQAGVPSVFYSAAGVSIEQELSQFASEVGESNLPGRDLFADVTLHNWDTALRLLERALPNDEPSIVVLDEVPYLAATDSGFEGILQKNWDRLLCRKPVLLILIGSDLSMMEALDTYGRPFHQRGKPMLLNPLSPSEVGSMLGLAPAAAIDAYLVTGGLPLICAEWSRGDSLTTFLTESLSDPTSALLVSAERALAAEFPTEARAQVVMTAIGSGECTYTTIRQSAGGIPQASLQRALQLLLAKRIIEADRPLSTRPSKETRYRITDPYLRFWCYFLAAHVQEVERGRGDRVLSRVKAGWSSWRGRAIEPLVRDALSQILPDQRSAWLEAEDAAVIGGYWTRTNDVEVDLVGVDRAPVARRIGFVGSIKWHERTEFGQRELASLVAHRDRVPGASSETSLVAVARSGVSKKVQPALSAYYGPDELIDAWR